MSKLQSSWIVVALSVLGCGVPKQGPGADDGPDPGTSGGESSSSSGDGITSIGMTTVHDTETSPTDPSITTDPTEGSSETCSFICDTSDTIEMGECDLWAQDCPEGEKCMPWANDGGNAWNSSRCTPVEDNPGQPGDECQVEGSGVSGIDNCGLGSMCWNVDENNNGTCVAFCGGSEANPTCDDPSTNCVIANEGFLILCLLNCDPLTQDCHEGEACYPVNDSFACAPDASGTLGLFGDPCEFINACDANLFCASAEAVPGCAGSTGCCSNFCDLADADPSAACVGAGQECVTWYEEGQAPPDFQDVGACAIPQ